MTSLHFYTIFQSLGVGKISNVFEKSSLVLIKAAKILSKIQNNSNIVKYFYNLN